MSGGQREDNNFQSIYTTLVNSLGVSSVMRRSVCTVPHQDTSDNAFAKQLSNIVNGPHMEGVNVMFVVVPSDPLAADNDSSEIAFRAGLEVSHALRPILTKPAHAMALQVRKHAASQDPLAALFENQVGLVRDGTSALITCSDRGLEGAVGAVKGLLGHLVSVS